MTQPGEKPSEGHNVDRRVLELTLNPKYMAALETLKKCASPNQIVRMSGAVADILILALDHGMQVERERVKG